MEVSENIMNLLASSDQARHLPLTAVPAPPDLRLQTIQVMPQRVLQHAARRGVQPLRLRRALRVQILVQADKKTILNYKHVHARNSLLEY